MCSFGDLCTFQKVQERSITIYIIIWMHSKCSFFKIQFTMKQLSAPPHQINYEQKGKDVRSVSAILFVLDGQEHIKCE